MAKGIYRVDAQDQYLKAGPTDFIELLPVSEGHGLCVQKWVIEILFDAITGGEIIHLTGPTGSGKPSLIEALCTQGNFTALCAALRREAKPLKVYRIKMVIFETPGELYHRRALKNGATYDEESKVVQALRDSARSGGWYVLLWLEEIGRVLSDNIQGGLLTLMNRDGIVLPDDTSLSGRNIAWVADSNYQAEQPLYFGPRYAPAPALILVPAQSGAPRQPPAGCLQTREYQTEIVIDGEPVPAYGTACLQADGSWKIISGPFTE